MPRGARIIFEVVFNLDPVTLTQKLGKTGYLEELYFAFLEIFGLTHLKSMWKSFPAYVFIQGISQLPKSGGARLGNNMNRVVELAHEAVEIVIYGT